MTVISFAKAKEGRSPHWTGTVKCIGCGHEPIAVAPMGTVWVECPSCHLHKAAPKHPFGADQGDVAFTCSECGSDALNAFYRKGRFNLMCMGCGIDHTDAVFGG